LPVQSIHFRAADGVALGGWLVPATGALAGVILVPGFDSDRAGMIPYARMLHRARFNVLLYDSRGTGGSGGRFSFGAREVEDVRGAEAYLQAHLGLVRHGSAILGVSLGAGVAIVAASRLPAVRAVVADSPYVNQDRFFDGLDHLALHGVSLPLAPTAQWTADVLTGASFGSFSPLDAVRRLGARPLLLIHSRDDHNPTTPYRDAVALRHAAGSTARLWIAPRGGHAGALAADPGAYRRHVIPLLRSALAR
jgi:pimeloyl-ACP methyl ester carboxylesterase